MNWRLKSAAFRALSCVPFGSQLHYLAQRYVTRTLPRSPKLLDAHWDKAGRLIAEYQKHADRPIEQATFLEIGAGRDLAAALALRARGVSRVLPVDIERLAKLDLIQHAARHIFARANLPIPVLETWDNLEKLGISYRAPATTESVNEPVDCVTSFEVLEHIDPAGLSAFARDSRRLLRDGGVAIHSIDYSDHFARGDASIDRFNFLQFDDAGWAPHNRPIQYVSRLRPSDYRQIFTDAGWRIVAEDCNPGVLTKTSRDHIASRFGHYDEADLLALNGRLVLQAT